MLLKLIVIIYIYIYKIWNKINKEKKIGEYPDRRNLRAD